MNLLIILLCLCSFTVRNVQETEHESTAIFVVEKREAYHHHCCSGHCKYLFVCLFVWGFFVIIIIIVYSQSVVYSYFVFVK